MNLDLSSIKTVKGILIKYGVKPSMGMGQNFLVNREVLEKIVKSADLKSDDTILEIGPGIGTLTQKLAEKTERVVAVEKDNRMCQILKETLKDYKNTEIINDDILKIKNLKLEQVPRVREQISNYKIVANIPYYLTSPLIRKFLENPPNGKQPEKIILMVQKEVAQRICANPPNMTHSAGSGSSRANRGMSILAVSVQFYAKAKIISYIKKENFWPAPKVDSAIIKITPHKNNISISSELFFKIVKAGFSQPRKQLGNNFLKMLKLDKQKINLWLSKNNISPAQRAETLSVDDWKNLLSTASHF
ncbi:MAG: ribosomal RNA small subunit methyltransferase A [Candidatus Staskawiczbacteria bacterium]|nr:ribosomal RNA small subunit methyltransferase A [Candidatus Staskawiczbacteria bacterium]